MVRSAKIVWLYDGKNVWRPCLHMTYTWSELDHTSITSQRPSKQMLGRILEMHQNFFRTTLLPTAEQSGIHAPQTNYKNCWKSNQNCMGFLSSILETINLTNAKPMELCLRSIMHASHKPITKIAGRVIKTAWASFPQSWKLSI